MKYSFDGYNYLIRLDKDELLIESLTRFAVAEKVQGAWVSAIGGAFSAELGFYQLGKKEYEWKLIDELLEIVSIQGTLAWQDDAPTLHLHAVLADSNYRTYGGHLKELVVGGACEIFVHVWNEDRLTRFHSDEIGLNLIDL